MSGRDLGRSQDGAVAARALRRWQPLCLTSSDVTATTLGLKDPAPTVPFFVSGREEGRGSPVRRPRPTVSAARLRTGSREDQTRGSLSIRSGHRLSTSIATSAAHPSRMGAAFPSVRQ